MIDEVPDPVVLLGALRNGLGSVRQDGSYCVHFQHHDAGDLRRGVGLAGGVLLPQGTGDDAAIQDDVQLRP